MKRNGSGLEPGLFREPLADLGGIQTGSDVPTPLRQRLAFQRAVLPSCGAWNTSVSGNSQTGPQTAKQIYIFKRCKHTCLSLFVEKGLKLPRASWLKPGTLLDMYPPE